MKRWLLTVAKLAATVALLVFVFSRVDLAQLASRLNPQQIALALVAAMGVLLVQSLVAALRLCVCTGLLDRTARVREAWVACQLGGFFSHTPISFIGGDAMRVWHLVKLGMPVAAAAKAVIVDRILGLVSVVLLVAATAPPLHEVITDPRMWAAFVLLLAAGLIGIGLFFLLGLLRLPTASRRLLARLAELATVARYLIARPARAGEALLLAFAINVLNIVAIWLIAAAYGIPAGLRIAAIGSPVVFLIAMVPISLAGWGVREGAFVVAFGLFGIPAADALTVSITFGLGVLLAYCPAIFLFLAARRKAASIATAAGCVPASSPPTARS